jgi:hypothetical protein
MPQPPERPGGRPTPETASSNVQVTGTALDSLRLHAPADAVPDPADVAALLELSAERDTWQRVALGRERDAYRCGHADGMRLGYERGRSDEAAEREAAFRAWVTGAGIASGAVTHAELERRRWGPGGRDHFGDPREGDFPGRGRDAA